MTTYISFKKTLFTLVLLFSSILIQAQDLSFQLLDESSKAAITQATFQYGTQSGLSDEAGYIYFQKEENTDIYLSHLNYGEWTIAVADLQAVVKQGYYYKAERLQQLQPVTIIGLRPKMEEKSTIDFQEQELLSHDGGAVLNQTPLIASIRKSGSYGFDPVMRGFKYDQLNVVIDGVQACAAACPNRMDPATSQIAPNMMSEVEVFKGPHSLRYGSAFGGTINFVQSSPRLGGEADFYGRLSSSFETNGEILRTEALVGYAGKKHDLGVFGSYSEGKHYEDGEGNSVAANFNRASIGAKLALQLTDKQVLTLSASNNKATDVDFPALPMDLREDDTWLLNAAHQFELNAAKLKHWRSSVYMSKVDHLMDNLLKNLEPRMMNASTAAKTNVYGGRTEGEWRFGNNKLYAGVDAKIEAAEGIRTREFLMGPMMGKTVHDNAWQEGQISKTALFAEYHFKLAKINATFSSRLEYNKAEVKDASEGFSNLYSETTDEQINPSFSIGGIRNFDQGFFVGLWLGRAQRSASMTERYINFFPVGLDPYELVGNPNLATEKNNQIDLSFGWKKMNSNIEINLFASLLNDYISSEIKEELSPVIPMSPGVRQYINIDDALMTGFECTWQQKLLTHLDHELSLAYTYGQNTTADEALPEIAPMDIRYNLRGHYLNNKLTPELKARYVMKQDRVASSFGEQETPSFALVDVKVSYQVNKLIRLSAMLNNVLDETYYEHLNRSVRSTPNAIYAPGRSFAFMLSVDLM